MMLTLTKAAEIRKSADKIAACSEEKRRALDRRNYALAKKMQRKINFHRGRIEELETGKKNDFADEQ